MKERNISIDILKCIAALFITNSHMEVLYHPYEYLATGGVIGDVLFFFCSGFTLFLGRMGRFDNWYKRRINRIYPTVFAWAIMGAFLFNKTNSMDDIVLHGGGWFVTCIMLYYIVLYFIRKYFFYKLKIVFGVILISCIIGFFFIEHSENFNMYGNTYFKWFHYFLFMLLGSILGISQNKIHCNLKYDSIKLIVSIILFYVFLSTFKIPSLHELQIISLIPLLSLTYYFYKICNTDTFRNIYYNKYSGTLIRFIGGLCLEIYLIQSSLFTDKMNDIFPINLIIMFIIILIGAYILRCCSRFFAQTFKEQDYDWRAIWKLL